MYIGILDNTANKQVIEDTFTSDRYQTVSIFGKNWLMSPDPLDSASFIDKQSIRELKSDYKLSSRAFKSTDTSFALTDKLSLTPGKTLMIAGPCSVESYDQIMQSAEFLAKLGIKAFRAGAFKPRTTPWKFQGLGEEGLRLLEKVREQFGFAIVTEVRSGSQVPLVAEVADVVQVGAKAMYDHDILRGCGKLSKPIVLKRGFGSTIKEHLLAADFILQGGNDRVALCFRGTRDFETDTRFTMDIGAALRSRELSHLPIIVDPSHGIGIASLVPDLALAGAAILPTALLIEVHPKPSEAKSDAAQALSHDVFKKLYDRCQKVCNAVGGELI